MRVITLLGFAHHHLPSVPRDGVPSIDVIYLLFFPSGVRLLRMARWSISFASRNSHCWMLLLLLLSRFSHVWLCATPLTAAPQAPLSLWFSRQEHRSGLPFPSPMRACMLSCFSRVQSCATLWTAAHQAPPSTGFSRQEYWRGLPFPSPHFWI